MPGPISVSKSTDMSAKFHADFTVLTPASRGTFMDIITTRIWSPIVWQNGRRAKANFLSCSYIALDFDNGEWTLDDAKFWVRESGLAHIIGTSKSHQKEKRTEAGDVKEACDRFRVVVPLSETITDREHYEYQMRSVMQLLPCDQSCKDAARFFYPCTAVVSSGTGHSIQVSDLPAGTPTGQDLFLSRQRSLDEIRENRILPDWILTALHSGVGPNESRHTTCYRLGAMLYELGLETDLICRVINASALAGIGETDIKRAVENGAQRARQDFAEFVSTPQTDEATEGDERGKTEGGSGVGEE